MNEFDMKISEINVATNVNKINKDVTFKKYGLIRDQRVRCSCYH